MSITVPLALLGWIPICVLLYALLPRTRAVVISILGAVLFLPPQAYALPGVLFLTKTTACAYGVLLATVILDCRRLFTFRPTGWDLPMAVWCMCPLATSLSNGLGVHDGLSGISDNVLQWGVPYLVGRLHFRDLASLRSLACGLFIGGLIYVPLCLFEVRMSPQLNLWVYGYGGAGIEYHELGKWGSRPYVFMGNGLALGMFMTAASLAGAWLWATGSLKRLRGHSIGWLVLVLIGTAIICKNMGALVLLAGGLGCLGAIRQTRRALVVYALIAVAPGYVMLRSTGKMGGDLMINIVSQIHQRRAESLQTRLDNEDRLVEKALQRPVLGWGGWGRSRVFSEEGHDITLADGLWVIAFGVRGLIGLVAVMAVLLLPAVAYMHRFPVRTWIHPAISPGGCLAVLMALFAIDCLFNAMLNPAYLLAAGGLVSVASNRRAIAKPVRRPKRVRPVSVRAVPRYVHT